MIDGDTTEVLISGKVYAVCYIGINTPEADQPFGDKATQKNKVFLASGVALLVKDVSETDKYSRLPRHVVSNDIFVNKVLVKKGYAQASTYLPDVACSNTFKEAQELAQENDAGVWESYGDESETISNNCHPSYPTACSFSTFSRPGLC
ncbi:MAG: thermonuclease family protein [Anaerolineales bacterium]